MNRKELQQRTKKFHVDVIKLCSDFQEMLRVLKLQNN